MLETKERVLDILASWDKTPIDDDDKPSPDNKEKVSIFIPFHLHKVKPVLMLITCNL